MQHYHHSHLKKSPPLGKGGQKRVKNPQRYLALSVGVEPTVPEGLVRAPPAAKDSFPQDATNNIEGEPAVVLRDSNALLVFPSCHKDSLPIEAL